MDNAKIRLSTIHVKFLPLLREISINFVNSYVHFGTAVKQVIRIQQNNDCDSFILAISNLCQMKYIFFKGILILSLEIRVLQSNKKQKQRVNERQ